MISSRPAKPRLRAAARGRGRTRSSAASATRRSRSDDARRYSRRLGLSACESVTAMSGAMLGEQLPDPPLVRRVDDRPEQADCDRLDLALPRARRAIARTASSSSGRRDRAVGRSMRSGISKVSDARNVGRRVLLRVVEQRRAAAALAEQEDVRVPCGAEQSGPGGRPGDDGVGRARRAEARSSSARPRRSATAEPVVGARPLEARRGGHRSGSSGVVGRL